jgi:hypothetical protein
VVASIYANQTGAPDKNISLTYLVSGIERTVPGQHRYAQPTDSARLQNNKAPAAAGAL